MAITKYQIFVSSTYTDLKDVRDSVNKTILSLPHLPVGMEYFSADDAEQWEIIKEAIDSSDYYVLIIGSRYGSLAREGISYTEKEYDYAIKQGIPVLAFVRRDDALIKAADVEDDPEKIGKLKAFKEKVLGNKLCSYWSNIDELNKEIAISIGKAITRYPRTGWIRADSSFQSSTDEVSILASSP